MKEKNKKPIVAPGNAKKVLNKDASQKEKNKGDYTRVFKFSWDEVDE